MIKPAQQLRLKESAILGEYRLCVCSSLLIFDVGDKKVVPRTSQSQLKDASRSVSSASSAALTEKQSAASLHISAFSADYNSSPPVSKEDAMLKTMRSLEGSKLRGKDRDVLGAIKRPAPSPPRPRSLDSARVDEESKGRKVDPRRSLGLERLPLVEVSEEAEEREVIVASPGKRAGEYIYRRVCVC